MFLSWKSSLQICLILIVSALAMFYWFVEIKSQEARLAFLSAQLEYSQSVDRLDAAVQNNADALLEILISDVSEICLPDASNVVQEALQVEQNLLAMLQSARDAYRYESVLPLSDVRLLQQYITSLQSIKPLLESARSIRVIYQNDIGVCFTRIMPGVPA